LHHNDYNYYDEGLSPLIGARLLIKYYYCSNSLRSAKEYGRAQCFGKYAKTII